MQEDETGPTDHEGWQVIESRVKHATAASTTRCPMKRSWKVPEARGGLARRDEVDALIADVLRFESLDTIHQLWRIRQSIMELNASQACCRPRAWPNSRSMFGLM